MVEEEGKPEHQRVLVKGYMRPDGTSYYVVIPKKIRELFGLSGGEYFIMKAKPEKGKIMLEACRVCGRRARKRNGNEIIL